MSSVASKSLQLPSGYQEFLQELKGRIRTAQVRAAFAVNRELVLLYWSIGRDLSQRLDKEDWGGKIVDRLSRDLQAEFPGVEGFSPRSLRYMGSVASFKGRQFVAERLSCVLGLPNRKDC